ncbi:MAG: helix-turn-helix domain-containing protein [Acidimicrobiales bacterium]
MAQPQLPVRPRLVGARQVAARLGIGETKARELMAGELPTVRIGRRKLVPEAELDRFVEGLSLSAKGSSLEGGIRDEAALMLDSLTAGAS